MRADRLLEAREAAAKEVHWKILESGQDKPVGIAEQVSNVMEEKSKEELDDVVEVIQFNKSTYI
jgi:predicted house-cleaning noncanonical NTP pyrophosphatase (MazG superfamily)